MFCFKGEKAMAGTTEVREKFLALARRGIFPGRKKVRQVAKNVTVKVRRPVPPYKGEHEVESITLEKSGKGTAQVRYRGGIRNLDFEALTDVFIASPHQ